MRAGVTDCIVFDDDDREGGHRLGWARDALARFAELDGVTVANPEPVHVTSDAEVLDMVSNTDDWLLLADMRSEKGRGNIGARLLRCIAQRPAVQGSGRTICLTRHNVSTVYEGLANRVHAFCGISKRSPTTDDLFHAICHAYAPDWAAPGAFPATEPVELWDQRIQDEVQALLGVEKVSEGEIEIAMLLASGLKQTQIDVLLKAAPKVGNLLKTVETAHGADDPEHALLILRRELEPYLNTPDDQIFPALCDKAQAGRKKLTEEEGGSWDEEGESHQRYLFRCWLTAGEDRLAKTFLELYAEQKLAIARADEKPRLHLSDDKSRVKAILAVIGSPHNDAMPEYELALAESGEDATGLAHALWRIHTTAR